MIVPVDQRVEFGEHFGHVARLVPPADPEGWHRLEGELAHHPQSTQGNARRPQFVRPVRADFPGGGIAGDQSAAGHPARQIAESPPGAVGGGGQRPSQGLGVDVALVLQSQTVPVELCGQRMDRDAGLHAHQT